MRTTVVPPPGAFADLERLLEAKFGLRQAIIGDATPDGPLGTTDPRGGDGGGRFGAR